MTLSQVEFESGFLTPGSSRQLDISRFEKGNAVLPGTYSVEIFVNDQWMGRMQIPFSSRQSNDDAKPCFSKKALETIGIAMGKLTPEVLTSLAAADACLRLDEVVAGATTSFDFGEQRLDLSVPQIGLNRNARGYVSPENWDAGVTAGILGYDFNSYHYGGNSSQTQNYLGLNAGLNVDGWRFRHNGAYSSGTGDDSRYQDIQTFVQHDLTAWKSQLTVGDAYTSGELFDSTAFRGVSVATDDRMLPDSMRGYAPTVRGVASTNAKVTVKQNGAIIYEATVAPGAFEINDLYATGYGGDLQVTVLEADGRASSFSVPYAAVPLSLRPGVDRFSATAGQLRDSRLSGKPGFVQGTWQHGFTNLFTGYAGVTASEGYGSLLVGGAFNTSAGAIGVDLTQSQTRIVDEGNLSGSSARISYSKLFSETDTHFSVAAYRYSTGGFFTLNDAMLARNGSVGGMDTVMRQQHRAQLSLTQKMGDKGGQLFATGSTSTYWNRSGAEAGYAVGYNNTFHDIGYNVSANRQRSSKGTMDTMYYASLTIPLGTAHPLTLTGNMTRDSAGRIATQATLSGAAFDDNSLSYGVTSSHANGGATKQATSGSANVQYHSANADFSANVGAGPGYNQRGFGVRGAVVAHPGGVTLSQPVSDTIGIVEAEHAADACVVNASGLRVDGRGYAVVPSLTPYNVNTVELDPKGLSTDVELQTTSQQTAPRAGAVVMLKYATVTGRSAVIHALQEDGAALPFGASVFNAQGTEVGLVGQASRIFARGLEPKGRLAVKWGDDASTMCHLDYTLPAPEKNGKSAGYQQIEARCTSAVPH